MEFIKINKNEAGKVLADKIGESLQKNNKVLWLLSGGSNISISIEALNLLKNNFGNKLKELLSVTLTDERYGPVGHADSNWQQLSEAGFDFNLCKKVVPVLTDASLEETTRSFSENYQQLTCGSDIIIGQFGIGSDGHTVGVLPGTIGVTDTDIACGYISEKFIRISLTLSVIKHIQLAMIFAFGPDKREVIEILQSKEIPLNIMPAQILKKVSESCLYSS